MFYYIIVFDELHILCLATLVTRIVCFLCVANNILLLYIKSVHLLDIIQYYINVRNYIMVAASRIIIIIIIPEETARKDV